jgi:hypothetical protein
MNIQNNASLNRNSFSDKAVTPARDISCFLASAGDILNLGTQEIFKAVPTHSNVLSNQKVHQLVSDAVEEQRLNLMQQPSSSNDPRLRAMEVLESRQFQPASGAKLKIRLTAKGLGGTLTARQREIVSDQRARINELLEQQLAYVTNINDLHHTLETKMREGDAYSARMLSDAIQQSQKALNTVHRKLTFANGELQRVARGETPHPLAAYNGERPAY